MQESQMPASQEERTRLKRAGSLHWFHWFIVAMSLTLTTGAAYFAKKQADEKVYNQFVHEADQASLLLQERMLKYEDALWSGVAAIKSLDGSASDSEWRDFASSLRIDQKYPGIDGIGVILAVGPNELPAYLEEQRVNRPDFKIYPAHEQPDLFPITYIEPVEFNYKAIGLDMAHETNRYAAAKRARDTGKPQITGPITLVQDEKRMPGFLLFAPYYESENPTNRKESFAGMVYAPFRVPNLMNGVLARTERRVGVRITDGDEILYDENNPGEPDYDPDPLYTKTLTANLYGREWELDVHSTASFHEAVGNAQPLIILIAGVLIDLMLILLFLMITRANRNALNYADNLTSELQTKAKHLEASNQELERFAYVASHDLQEPLRMVGSFAGLIREQYQEKLDDEGKKWLGFMVDGAGRMQQLVRDLLSYSRLGRQELQLEPTKLNDLVSSVLEDLSKSIEETGAKITTDPLPQILADQSQIRLVVQNLLSNAIKFQREGESPRVHVGVETGTKWASIYVRDNGIGIDQKYADRIFLIFQRLHSKSSYSGTGLGLAICMKIVDSYGGRLWFESSPSGGTTFHFTVPLNSSLESRASLVRDSGAEKEDQSNDRKTNRNSPSRG